MHYDANNYDVVIIGGGPGGTAAGLTLLKRPGTRVAIIEQSNYDNPRIGESLSPGIRPLLSYLDLWEPFQATQSLSTYGSQAAWGGPEAQGLDFLFTIHGAGWNLDRLSFDRMLAETFAERGGTLLTGTRFQRAEETDDGCWAISLKEGNSAEKTIRSRYVIDATGRRGLFARQLGVPREVRDQLVGIARFGTLPSGKTIESVIMVEACEYGWWYTAPVPGNGITVALMTDADIARDMKATKPAQWQKLLERMPLSSGRALGVALNERPRSFLAHSSRLTSAGGENWLAIGDALCSHDPLSSSGIPHAIGTGVHGARVAANRLFGDGAFFAAYAEDARSNYNEYLETHWSYYLKEKRWPEALFWKRRTTVVCLDPEAKIIGQQPLKTNTTLHLELPYAVKLQAHCTTGLLTHQVVRNFSRSHPQFSDQQIILELQELVATGAVGIG